MHRLFWRAIWLLVPMAAALGAGAGLVYPRAARWDGFPPADRPPATEARLTPEPAGPAIGPQTQVRYRRYYRSCAQTEEVEVPAPGALQGMTRQDLSIYYGHWQVNHYSPGLVVLAAESDSGCPEVSRWSEPESPPDSEPAPPLSLRPTLWQ